MTINEVLEQEVLSLKETSQQLDVPENVLKNWVELRFRSIPFHVAGTGKKSGICFFKGEINKWFEQNGGRFLSKQVIEKRGFREKRKP